MQRSGLRSGSVKPWLLLAMLAIVLFLVLWFRPLEGRRDSGSTHPSVGQKLPPLELIPLTGQASTVTTEKLASNVVLINFWGTWCGPCQQELPHLLRLETAYRDRPDFQLISVSCGGGEGYEDVEQLRQQTLDYLAAFQSNLATWCDPDYSARRALIETVGFDGYPTTLVLDRDGVVRGMWNGYQPGMEVNVEAVVASLLVSK